MPNGGKEFNKFLVNKDKKHTVKEREVSITTYRGGLCFPRPFPEATMVISGTKLTTKIAALLFFCRCFLHR